VNQILWVATGLLTGLLASHLAKVDEGPGVLLDTLVGVAGALPAAWLLLPISANSDLGDFNLLAVLGALLGALVALCVRNVIRGR
jgi:uncharacterized membrane protein YeaQ/YmgE (transglycosylase-associated protein family)